MASVTFIGAAQQVTGSCYVVETAHGSRFLFDCGIRQGNDDVEDNRDVNFPFDPSKLDAVILSHAHLDQRQPAASRSTGFSRSHLLHARDIEDGGSVVGRRPRPL